LRNSYKEPNQVKVALYMIGLLARYKDKEEKMANVQKVGEVYKCDICGNVVEVKEAGGGELVCCGEPMKLM